MPRENHQLEPGPLGTAEFCSKDAGSLLQLLDLRRTRDSIAHSMGETLAYNVPAPNRASCPPALAVIEAEVSRVEASIQGGLRKVWLGQQQACKTSGPSHGTYPLCGPGGDVWVSAAMTSIQALEHRCAQQACAIEDLRCVQVALGAEANREAEAKLALARELTAAHTAALIQAKAHTQETQDKWDSYSRMVAVETACAVDRAACAGMSGIARIRSARTIRRLVRAPLARSLMAWAQVVAEKRMRESMTHKPRLAWYARSSLRVLKRLERLDTWLALRAWVVTTAHLRSLDDMCLRAMTRVVANATDRTLSRGWATWVTRTSRARVTTALLHTWARQHMAMVMRIWATAARDASRRACFAARKSLNHAWVAWVRAAGGTLGSCDVHRGALQCVLRCLKATVMRQTILCWRKAAHCVHYELLRDVRVRGCADVSSLGKPFVDIDGPYHVQGRAERRALRRRYRALAWRLALQRRVRRALQGAWGAWYSATAQRLAAGRRRRRLARTSTCRAFGRWAAMAAASDRRAAAVVRALSIAARGDRVALVRAVAIWRHAWRPESSAMITLKAVPAGQLARNDRAIALQSALNAWRMVASRTTRLRTSDGMRLRAAGAAWGHWVAHSVSSWDIMLICGFHTQVLQVAVGRELKQLEDAVAQLATRGRCGRPRRSLLR
mmetsp:Transcript_2227/g.6640  ORF Transcript_2227/g.6640 Transcript_2227/m.6640 type:complete len:670 (-) Transcript_2227:149-2158(-)